MQLPAGWGKASQLYARALEELRSSDLAAAAASLGLAAREHAQRRALEAKNGCVVVTPSEKRRNLLVAALSFAALLFVGMELVLHSPEGAELRRSIDLRAPGER